MGRFRLNEKRCVNHFQQSSCALCAAACPHGAIAAGRIDADKCRGCGLCLAVCPAGAIETSTPYGDILAREAQKPRIRLACRKMSADSAFDCLAFLNERVLFALARRGEVSLAADCGGCGEMGGAPLERAVALCNAALPEERRIRVLADAPQPEREMMNRRGFLKELAGAAAAFFSEVKRAEAPEAALAPYREAAVLERLEAAAPLPAGVFYACEIGGACSACLLCVQICPHKALTASRASEGVTLRFDSRRCGGCRVCADHCPQKAIRIHRERAPQAEFLIALPRCAKCGRAFHPLGGTDICLECRQKERRLS